ncbi:Hypothetical protein GbCGDNIH9_8733 [Granulibacter bethesdensis]|uniref:Uncharacterized protein n=1 Tax=Granulibacter bethesdensis TaxID=364410 RepID=A0AAC9KE97_9PROT|nr:Hypothetical protein GbCGDNIH9_8733 [Granulibacter bethesdensis]APH63094.1 Hypothetical protein GbCGDNIH8_8733 [Granulibacter bethesdensis]
MTDSGTPAQQHEHQGLRDKSDDTGRHKRDRPDIQHAGQNIEQQITADRQQTQGQGGAEWMHGQEPAEPDQTPTLIASCQKTPHPGARQQPCPEKIGTAAQHGGGQGQTKSFCRPETVSARKCHHLTRHSDRTGQGGQQQIGRPAARAAQSFNRQAAHDQPGRNQTGDQQERLADTFPQRGYDTQRYGRSSLGRLGCDHGRPG